MGPLFQRRCEVLFSHRLDLTLIKLVNDETALSENQLIHVVLTILGLPLRILFIICESVDHFFN